MEENGGLNHVKADPPASTDKPVMLEFKGKQCSMFRTLLALVIWLGAIYFNVIIILVSFVVLPLSKAFIVVAFLMILMVIPIDERNRWGMKLPGNNVGIDKDHTIFSLIDGLVKFEKYGLDRKKISVYPWFPPPVNLESYRERKRESFRLERERRKERREAKLDEPLLVLLLQLLKLLKPIQNVDTY